MGINGHCRAMALPHRLLWAVLLALCGLCANNFLGKPLWSVEKGKAPTHEYWIREREPAEIARYPRLCERLSDERLHRWHAGTPELERLDRRYALTDDVLRTGYAGGGAVKSGLLRRVANSAPVTALTLGGSLTRGHGCGETSAQSELECAWPSRLERWGGARLSPGSRGRWVHGAEHGAGSEHILQRVGGMVRALAQEPDLVIIDTAVNDFSLGVESATVGYERLIRTIQELLPSAQIILFEAGCRGCLRNNKVVHRRRQIALHYNIPLIDYGAMVQNHNKLVNSGPDLLWPFSDPPISGPYVVMGEAWPDFEPQCNVTKITCCPDNHPPWPVHQYISDAIAFGLVQLLRDGACAKSPLPRPFHEQSELDKFPSCAEPLVWHDALAGRNGSATEPVSDGRWSLYEDRPGRPGWISTEPGSTISFPVCFGDRPMLAVTYLRSYAHLGTARIRFTSHHGESSSAILCGLWDKNYSLPDTAFFIDRPDGALGDLLGRPLLSDGYDPHSRGHSGWKDVGNGRRENYTIDISLETGEKFKIIQVISC